MSLENFVFRAFGFTHASEDYAGYHAKDVFYVDTMWNDIPHKALPDLLKQAEALEKALPNASVAVGSSFGPRVSIHAHDSCVLYGTLNFSDYNNDYPVTATAPSLEWIVEHLPLLKNHDPMQVWRVGDMLAWAEPSTHEMRPSSIVLCSIDFVEFESFSFDDPESPLDWLNQQTLNDVLKSHGVEYESDEGDDAMRALFIKRVAEVAEHPDPMKLIAAYFGEKQAAMLRLKGII